MLNLRGEVMNREDASWTRFSREICHFRTSVEKGLQAVVAKPDVFVGIGKRARGW